MKKKGFTLIELMIVVAIIGILAAIAIPNMVYTKKKAKLSACKSNLKNIAAALDMYAGDNNDTYPTTGTTPAADAGVLITAGYMQKGVTCPVSKTDYTYTMLIDVYTVSCPAPTGHYYGPKSTATVTTLRYLSQGGVECIGGDGNSH